MTSAENELIKYKKMYNDLLNDHIKLMKNHKRLVKDNKRNENDIIAYKRKLKQLNMLGKS